MTAETTTQYPVTFVSASMAETKGYTDADALRFLDKVQLPPRGIEDIESCWIWTGARHSKTRGYGKFRLGGKVMNAHKASYVLFVGPVPTGHVVGHQCNLESCVNPFHFKAETQADNMRYCVACGRHGSQAGD